MNNLKDNEGLYIDIQSITQGGDEALTPLKPTDSDIRDFYKWNLKETKSKYFRLKEKGLWTLFYNLNLHTDSALNYLLKFQSDTPDFKTPQRVVFDNYLNTLEKLLNCEITLSEAFFELDEKINGNFPAIINTSNYRNELLEVTIFFIKLVNKLFDTDNLQRLFAKRLFNSQTLEELNRKYDIYKEASLIRNQKEA